MKHLDNHQEILKIPDLKTRMRLLGNRRVTLGVTLGLILPFSSLLVGNFIQNTLFNNISLSTSKDIPNKDIQTSLFLTPLLFSNKLNNNLPPLGKDNINPPSPGEDNKNKNKNKFNFKLLVARVLAFFTTVLIYYVNTKYNIINNILLFPLEHLNITNKILLSICYIFSLIFLLYNFLSLFILSIKNDIELDLTKIKIKFIKNHFEDLLILKKENCEIDILKKQFKNNLYISLVFNLIYIISLFIFL
jgi:hypothetical protein